VIAVALGVIAAVLLLTVGVVTAEATPDYLTFFGASIRTTSAQIFLVGAICTWALLVASWLLTVGVRRSRERGVQLAEANRRAAARRAVRRAARRSGAGSPAEAGAVFESRAASGSGAAFESGAASGSGPSGRLIVDGEEDTLILTGLADGSGLGPRQNWQSGAEERVHSRPVEE
jgi:hypothetical protein